MSADAAARILTLSNMHIVACIVHFCVSCFVGVISYMLCRAAVDVLAVASVGTCSAAAA